jgi:hypothetical protein
MIHHPGAAALVNNTLFFTPKTVRTEAEDNGDTPLIYILSRVSLRQFSVGR